MQADTLECAVTREMWVRTVERSHKRQTVASIWKKQEDELRILESKVKSVMACGRCYSHNRSETCKARRRNNNRSIILIIVTTLVQYFASWSRVLEKLIVTQLINNFRILRKESLITIFTNPTTGSSKHDSNINISGYLHDILLSTTGSSKRFLPSRFLIKISQDF